MRSVPNKQGGQMVRSRLVQLQSVRFINNADARGAGATASVRTSVAVALLLASAAVHADPVIGVATLPKVSVGDYHMLLAKTDGTVWSWGWDSQGQLGLGAGTTATPTQIPTLSGVVSVVARNGFSAALKADGTVWVWGQQGNGWMGPTDTSSKVPVQVKGLSGIIGIDVGWGFSAYAIDYTNKVYGWGRNSYGELGTGSATPAKVTTPQLISGLSKIVDLRAADTSVIALDSLGQVYQWATIGQPTPISTMPGVSGAVAIGADGVNNTNASFAVLSNGKVWSWGDTSSAVTRCGQPKQSGVTEFPPAEVTGFASVTSVSSGPDGEDIFLDSAGQAWTCGGGSGGQQGDGTTGGTSTGVKVGPLKVTQTTPFVNVAMGRSAAGIGTDGSVWTWGPQGTGVQGDGNLNASGVQLTPKQISINAGDPANVQPVFAGTQSVANSDGTTSVDVGVMYAPQHWSRTGKAYLVALLPNGQLYFYSSIGWTPYDPRTQLPAAYTGVLKGMLPLSIGTGDYRFLTGTQVLVGYGLGSGTAADSEMLTAGRYKVVLTLR
jgi:alpha-tubulin suppressor-like RCC1 family protein